MSDTLFNLKACTRQPLRWHGAKFREATRFIVPLIPEHFAYVEIFGGAAGVLLRKPQSKVEVYNDIDKQLVNFWAVLRDDASRKKLADLIGFTPFSRHEFDESYEPCECPIEAARRFVIRCYFGFGTAGSGILSDTNGFRSCDMKRSSTYARDWECIPQAIIDAGERMKPVTIECLDFRLLIPKFDSPDTFFYADPPYLDNARKRGGKGYTHEVTDRCHEELAWMLRACKGKVAVSGYPSSRYEEWYKGWIRRQKQVAAAGQRGAVLRDEVIWMNYEPPDSAAIS